MEHALEVVDRFINIISSAEHSQQRLKTEWEYLHKLLKSQPIAYDRIEAYLNILKHQDNPKKKSINRSHHSQMQHPEAKKYRLCLQAASKVLSDNQDKILVLKKQLSL